MVSQASSGDVISRAIERFCEAGKNPAMQLIWWLGDERPDREKVVILVAMWRQFRDNQTMADLPKDLSHIAAEGDWQLHGWLVDLGENSAALDALRDTFEYWAANIPPIKSPVSFVELRDIDLEGPCAVEGSEGGSARPACPLSGTASNHAAPT